MRGRPAVFLDRDGTIIVDADYLADPDGVRLIPGAAAAIRGLKEAGWVVVVVTNQSGIARGLYTEADYRAVEARVHHLLAARGAAPHATYHCPHHPDHTGPCPCRKPGLGMYRRAVEELGIDLARSWFVGDKVSDVLPAETVGGRGLLVRTGYGARHAADAPEGVEVAEDLSAAAGLILHDPPGSVDRPPGPG